MRKIYSLFAFVAMMVMSLSAVAAEFDIPSENSVLQSETYNMRLFKTWNFTALTVNGVEITPTTFTTSSEQDTSMPPLEVGYYPLKVTNEGMEGWYMGIGNIEFNPSKGGLYNNKNGIRYAILDGIKTGQIICIQGEGGTKLLEPEIGEVHTYAVNCNRIQKQSVDGTIPAWTASYLSNNGYENVVVEITDEIHAIQNEDAEVDADGNIISGGADKYRYFKAVIDGPLYIAFGKNAAIQGVQIWIDASAEEAVSSPSYKVVGVNSDSRNIELVPGESTFGAACHITYGIMESEDASYEDFEYDPEVGYFTVNASYDEDGDGIVKIQAVTVSDNGVVSEPIEFQIEVKEIQLNAPVLTLNGFNGQERFYSISWTNNTLCGEDYSLIIEADNGEKYSEFEPNTGLDELVTCTTDATVKIKVAGYADGVATVEAEKAGVSIKRKNAEKGAEGAHDWDFVHLSEYQKALIKQDASVKEVVEKCYILKENGTEVPDTIYYSAQEYQDGMAADGTDLSSATAVLKESGWYAFDSSKGRTSIKVVEGGNDQNADGYGYAEDMAKVWDGIQISNPPYVNSKNEQTASILIYINDDLGLYLGSKPVITFPREAATAGEYVLMYIGYGGSNYTNSRYPVIYEVPVGELLSVTLGNNPHLFYIDVYTYDGLPTDEYSTSVECIKSAPGMQKIVGYYGINGAKIAAPQKGINIVKYADGTTMKVLLK